MHPAPSSAFLPSRIYWAGWALAGAYNFLRAAFDLPVGRNLVFNAAHFGLWALLGLLILPVLERHPLRRHWRSWLFHIGFGSLMTQIDITLGHWLYAGLTGAYQGLDALAVARIAFQNCFHIGLLTYFGFVGVIQGSAALALARRRELQVAEHQSAALHAQLQSLRLQLQPHFLFNTLNTIGALMHYDVAGADRMLTRLSQMLRTSLREADTTSVTLGQEIAFIEAYVEIEKIRFEERLQVTWSVPVALLTEAVPPFILQPLVENAVKYGIAPRADGGTILIRAWLDGADLVLEVADDAPPGLASPAQTGCGIGLANTRTRLAAQYGSAAQLELVRTDGGSLARLRLPAGAALAQAA